MASLTMIASARDDYDHRVPGNVPVVGCFIVTTSMGMEMVYLPTSR